MGLTERLAALRGPIHLLVTRINLPTAGVESPIMREIIALRDSGTGLTNATCKPDFSSKTKLNLHMAGML